MSDESFLTVRQMLEEVRQDVKDIKGELPNFITWRQLWTALAGTAGLLLAILRVS